MSGCQESKPNQSCVPSANPGTGTKRGRRKTSKRITYPSQFRLLELFDYDTKAGTLTRKIGIPAPNGGILHNAAAGRTVGCFDGHRLAVQVDGKLYSAHRIIWIMVYGYDPENPIDHIDRDPKNNRLTNLREVSIQCNARNCKVNSNSKTGITGISYDNLRRKFRVQIKIDGRHKQLGRFDCIIEAAAARLAAEQCINWTTCDKDSSAYRTIKYYLEECYER